VTATLAWGAVVSVALYGLMTRNLYIAIPGLTLLTAAVAARFWARHGANRINYRCGATPHCAQIGQAVQLTFVVENPGPLPLPWVEIRDAMVGAQNVAVGERPPREFVNRLGLAWYQRVRRSYDFIPQARGHYRLGPARIRCSDPLSLFSHEREAAAFADFLVLPPVVHLGELGLQAEHPLGNPAHNRWLYRDPLSVAGARPYQAGDPQRHVHWRATARRGTLMTKLIEATSLPLLLILLDVQTTPKPWEGVRPAILELGCAAAASVAWHSHGRGYEVGLYGNTGTTAGGPVGPAMNVRRLAVPPSADPAQPRKILTALAGAGGYPHEDISLTLGRVMRGRERSCSIVLISPLCNRAVLAETSRLAGRGYGVTVLYTGEGASFDVPGIRLISLGGAERWRKIAEAL